MTYKALRPSLVLILMVILFLSLAWELPARAQAGDEQLEEGGKIYAENCQVCHGDQGQGRVGATLARNWPSIRPDLTIKAVIVNGVDGSPMPAWSEANGGPLSEAQIEALVAYILNWESGEPFVYTPPEQPTTRPPLTPVPLVEGDPNRGGTLYDENCAVCHGANGEGRVGATLARGWAGIRADLTVSTVIAKGVTGSAMPAWSQANGGPLSDTDVADLTAFILALPQIQQAAGMPTQAPAQAETPLTGWVGLAITIVLFGLIVGVILLAQRPKAGSG